MRCQEKDQELMLSTTERKTYRYIETGPRNTTSKVKRNLQTVHQLPLRLQDDFEIAESVDDMPKSIFPIYEVVDIHRTIEVSTHTRETESNRKFVYSKSLSHQVFSTPSFSHYLHIWVLLPEYLFEEGYIDKSK